MTVDYTGLIIDSDKCAEELDALESLALGNLEALENVEKILESEKADFYNKEHLISPPGGENLKWNDKRRAAYIADNSGQAIELVEHAKRTLRKTQSNIKRVGYKVSALNRKIRILELVAGISEANLE